MNFLRQTFGVTKQLTSQGAADCQNTILMNTIQIHKNIKLLIKENLELKERLQKLEEDNIKMHTRLLTEVTKQNKKVQDSKFDTFIPKRPFNSIIEADLSGEQRSFSLDEMEQENIRFNISGPSKSLRSKLKKLFEDKLRMNEFRKRYLKNKYSKLAKIPKVFTFKKPFE